MPHLIRQMGHVAMTVPDPEASANDLVEITGLKITERRDGRIYLSSNQRHHEISYRPGPAAAVEAIGLEAMDEAAVDEVRRRLQADGVGLLDDQPLDPFMARAVRFMSPFGVIFEVHSAVTRDQSQRHVGPGSRPRRIEHVNVNVSDTLVARDFLTGVLGMELTDRTSKDEFLWFRADDGYHHTVAIYAGPPKLNHYAFDQNSLEDLVGIADTLVLKDRYLLWGPGRHGAGGNIFTYYIDPDGCVVENSIGMDRYGSDLPFEVRTWEMTLDPKSRLLNQWGSTRGPEDFTHHGMPFASVDAPAPIPTRAATIGENLAPAA